MGLPKRKLVFQTSVFRCYVSFREGNDPTCLNLTPSSLAYLFRKFTIFRVFCGTYPGWPSTKWHSKTAQFFTCCFSGSFETWRFPPQTKIHWKTNSKSLGPLWWIWMIFNPIAPWPQNVTRPQFLHLVNSVQTPQTLPHQPDETQVPTLVN